MKVIWALLCEKAIIDRETNNASFINVVEEIIVPASPPQMPPGSEIEPIVVLDLHMAILWARSNPVVRESGEARVRLIAPDETASISAELIVDLTESQRLRGIGHLVESPFPISQEGQYLFKVEAQTADLDWQEMFELPLWVKVQTDDPPYDPNPQTSVADG